MRAVIPDLLASARHDQRRCYLSKNTKMEGFFSFFPFLSSVFLQKPGAAPCTENKIYFPLLLLYVKSEHFQSSELLLSLFLKVQDCFVPSRELLQTPVAMLSSFSPLSSPRCFSWFHLRFSSIKFCFFLPRCCSCSDLLRFVFLLRHRILQFNRASDFNMLLSYV